MDAPDGTLSPTTVLDRLLTQSTGTRVLVVGDVMLDEYVIGSVERQSPEAPVPVLRAASTANSLGGAANAARQLAAFRAQVELCGLIGADRAGTTVIDHCRRQAIGTSLLVAHGTTTRKQRLVANRQQIARVDWEDMAPFPDDQVDGLIRGLAELVPPHVVVVSDYGKGCVTPAVWDAVLTAATRWKVPVLVDPAPGSFDRYRGATLIKANQREFEAAIARPLGTNPAPEAIAAAPALMEAIGVPELVVTLGECGLVVLGQGREPLALPATASGVVDVSGAGDTVMALLALCGSWGEPLTAAANVANEAAGIAVHKPGVAVVEPVELASRLARDPDQRLLSLEALAACVSAWRGDGERIVFTNGCFDLLHNGHLHLLREAAALGDRLVVAVNTDASIGRLKGADRPFLPLSERLAILAGISCVDAVVSFDDDDPAALIAVVRPDVLVKGADYEIHEIVGHEQVLADGGSVVTIPLQPGWSTSAIVERLHATR